jgi:hypothetical protein
MVELLELPQESVRLYGWVEDWAEAASPVRALLFGELVRRSWGVVTEQYPSDLYHDAQWIEANVNGPVEFLWHVRVGGTHIGPLAEVQERIEGRRERRVMYHVALTVERGQWTATFTTLVKVTDEGQVVPPPQDPGYRIGDAMVAPSDGVSRS